MNTLAPASGAPAVLVTRPDTVVPDCANAAEATIALAPMTDRIRFNIVFSLLHGAPHIGAIDTYVKYRLSNGKGSLPSAHSLLRHTANAASAANWRPTRETLSLIHISEPTRQ